MYGFAGGRGWACSGLHALPASAATGPSAEHLRYSTYTRLAVSAAVQRFAACNEATFSCSGPLCDPRACLGEACFGPNSLVAPGGSCAAPSNGPKTYSRLYQRQDTPLTLPCARPRQGRTTVLYRMQGHRAGVQHGNKSLVFRP